MARDGAISNGREAFARQEWRRAFAELTAADEADGLGPDDLERLAAAAYLVGKEATAVALWTRLHNELVGRGDVARAARWGFWLALHHLISGEMAHSTGWLARSERLLRPDDASCADLGYGRIVAGLLALGGGDAAKAQGHFRTALTLAQQFRDTDLLTISLLGEGQLLIAAKRHQEGIARLDEAMLAITAGEVSPIFAGIVYCAVILTCQQLFELHRAREWTLAMDDWCAAQPDLVPFRGQCLVHRSEILQRHGDWKAALEEAEHACAQLSGRSEGVVGRAHYQLGELHRLTGEFAAAERSYRAASRFGCEPQPGLSLLRLAEGEHAAAAAAMRGLIAASGTGMATGAELPQIKLLAACVEILLAAGEIEEARAAADRLAEAARNLGAPYLEAASAHARGSVLLEQGAAEAASAKAREAWTRWQELEVPYEAACAQVLLGRACARLGDREGARVHRESAARIFRRLGAAPALAALDAGDKSGPAPSGGTLTARELEVLALVSAGETNRRIAAALGISEHTVARHLGNIFNKLGVNSRTAASTIAHAQKLLAPLRDGQF